jgi:hypothetical protein
MFILSVVMFGVAIFVTLSALHDAPEVSDE